MNLPDVIDIEEYAASGRDHPEHVKVYRIRIDHEYFNVDQPRLTGRQLLELAKKAPIDRYSLREKRKGEPPRKVGLDDYADFTTKGVERFMTLPLDQTEGLVPELRRQFHLPPEDQPFLAGCPYAWETVSEANPGGQPINRIVFYGVAMPDGYTQMHVDIHFRIEALYPDTQIDMAYLNPPVARKDGLPIANLTDVAFDGKTWQQWSRHRTAANPWRPGIDNLENHLMLVLEWFEQEFRKR